MARIIGSAFIPIAVGLAAPGAMGQAGVTFKTLMLSGEPAPGVPGATFASFDSPRVNERGQTLFWARLEGTGVGLENEGSIWSERSGTLMLEYRQDDPAVFAQDIRWDGFRFPALDVDGGIHFTSGLHDATTNMHVGLGIFHELQPGFQLTIAREGFAAPGLPAGTAFSGLPLASHNSSGHVAFNANNGGGIWSTRSGSLELIVKAGDDASAAGAGYVFDFLDNPAQNAAGDLAFRASINNDPPGTLPHKKAFEYGIWKDTGAGPTLLVATSLDPSVDRLSLPAIDRDGVVTYWHAGPATRGIVVEGKGTIARDGLIAPGTSAFYSGISPVFAHNVFGQIAFRSQLTGPGINTENNSGVWRYSGNGVETVALESEPAAGLGPDVEYAVFGDVVISHSGRVAFMARLRGNAVTQADNRAIFAMDQTMQLVPVIRTGQQFDVGGGEMRTVKTVTFTHESTESGYGQFAADGTLVFTMTFTDLTGGVFSARVGCRVDADGDSQVTAMDFMEFMNLFNAGDPRADFEEDSELNLFDFLAFVNEFNAGC